MSLGAAAAVLTVFLQQTATRSDEKEWAWIPGATVALCKVNVALVALIGYLVGESGR
jgi:hypothetical protein